MGGVKLKESVERVGDASVTTVEYEFSDSVDFLAWESDKVERLSNSLKSIFGESPQEEPMVADIQVTKKTTKH